MYKNELVEEENPWEATSLEATAAANEAETEILVSSPQFSLHALASQAQLLDFRTMRLSGIAKHRKIHILIESGPSLVALLI